jgi:hypothetical protein
MTIRHYLQQQKRWSFAGVYLGIAASAMLALTARVRCPQCRSRLGQILSNVGGRSRFGVVCASVRSAASRSTLRCRAEDPSSGDSVAHLDDRPAELRSTWVSLGR